ncbi:MAG TPA: SatD family protein [Thermoleophilaceae bacterium]|jgi:biotin operon repressor
MFVLTLDQRASRATPDLVRAEANSLNDQFSSGLRLPFVRTAGDEMQALVSDPADLVDLVLRATRSEQWWAGVGIGAIDDIGETARDSRGPAFVSARAAVEQAKKNAWGCSVQGEPEALATALEDSLALLVFLRASRTSRAWELVDMATGEGMRAIDIARELGISKQAVSKQLRAAGFAEEQRGRGLAIALLQGSWTPLS